MQYYINTFIKFQNFKTLKITGLVYVVCYLCNDLTLNKDYNLFDIGVIYYL